MSINLIFANVGTGKTTYLAKIAHTKRIVKKYDKIYCNVPIDGTYQFNIKDLGKLHLEDALLLVDEGAIEFDNNVKLLECQKTYLRLHRHYNVDIIVISQSWEDVSIILRRLYNKIYLMKRSLIPGFSYMDTIRKKVDVNEETHQIEDTYYFDFILIRIFTRKYFYRRKYFKYFNSFDKPQLTPFEPIIWESQESKKKDWFGSEARTILLTKIQYLLKIGVADAEIDAEIDNTQEYEGDDENTRINII